MWMKLIRDHLIEFHSYTRKKMPENKADKFSFAQRFPKTKPTSSALHTTRQKMEISYVDAVDMPTTSPI